jgi:hypothetical protein
MKEYEFIEQYFPCLLYNEFGEEVVVTFSASLN